MATYTITGDQGWAQFRRNGKSEDIIDATGASWEMNNAGSQTQTYPVIVENSTSTVQVKNGRINGSYSLTTEWGAMYAAGNGAGVFLRECVVGSSITGWDMYQVWDGIRIRNVNNFLIDDIYLNISRDDALENDFGHTGTISNSLFEGCFSGISVGSAATPIDAVSNTVTIDNVLLGMATYLYEHDSPGTITHGNPIKAEPGRTPNIRMIDSVIAITDVDHPRSRFEAALDRVTGDSSGNYFLNMTDDALPGSYPVMPASFTTLSGSTARDFWATRRTAFLDARYPPDPPVTPRDPVITVCTTIDPNTGSIRVSTNEPFGPVDVTIGATNTVGTATPRTVTVTVS